MPVTAFSAIPIFFLCRVRTVPLQRLIVFVPFQLSADGGGAPVEGLGYFSLGKPLRQINQYTFSLFCGKMIVAGHG